MTYMCSLVRLHLCHLLYEHLSRRANTPMSPSVSAPILSSVIKPKSPCVPVPVSPGVSSTHSCNHQNHILIQQSHATTSVAQVSDGVDWKPIGLQNLCNTCYLNSVLQCLFIIDYYTSFLPAKTVSPLIKNSQKTKMSLKM